MIAPATPACCPAHPQTAQQAFLVILPRLKLHGKVYFRHVKDPERREEAICEMIALAWGWFLRLAQRGKDATQFASVLATYAARAVRSGRRLCGQEKARDVLSPLAQRRRGFRVGTLPQQSSLEGNVLDEALHDNTITPVVEQVHFRLDFPRWRGRRCARDRSLIDDLMVGGRAHEMARKYGLSRSRVSQLRGQFFQDWSQFCEGLSHQAHTSPAAAAALA